MKEAADREDDTSEPRVPSREVLRRSLTLVWQASRPQVVLVIVLEFVAAVVVAGQLLLGRQILIVGSAGDGAADALDQVLPELFALVTITALGGIVAAASVGQRGIVAQHVERAALDRVLERASSARLEDFDDPDFHDHLRRAEEAARFRPWQLASGFLGSISALLTSGGVVVAMALVQPLLAPLALLAYVPLGIATRRNSRHLLRLTVEHTDEARELAYLQRLMTDRRAAPELRNYLLTVPFLRRYDELYDRYLERETWLFQRRLRRSLIAHVFSAAVIAGGILLVAYLAQREGDLSLADAGVVAIAIAQLGNRLRALSGSGSSLFEATLFLADYFDFTRPETAPAAPQEQVTHAGEVLEQLSFEGVGFTYAGGVEALRDVTLVIEPGETIAVVGPSGSGKTTLVKLLAGLYEPTEGTIRWNGDVVDGVSPETRAGRVTVVFQEFSKLELPARTNIAAADIGRAHDDVAIHEAAASAGIDATLSRLASGYDTRLSPSYDHGVDLSEGQWQRVAIARAFFRPTPVIILDEPTASLDARAERHVLDTLRDGLSDRTIVLVTHRVTNACRADRVLVMDDGRVVDDGPPEALLRADGLFAEFAALQGVSSTERSDPDGHDSAGGPPAGDPPILGR